MKFEIIKEISGIKLIKLNSYIDDRGSYIKLFSKKNIVELGIIDDFVDDNFLISKKNSIRGLHFQKKFPEAKLLTCIKGKILDIVVDLRENSKTFKKFFIFELNDEKLESLYIPEGFAHGFLTIEDSVVLYKSSNYYYSDDQYGVSIFSEGLKFDSILQKYNIEKENIIITKKDKALDKI